MRNCKALFAALLLPAALAAGEVNPDADTRLQFKYLSVNDGLSQNSVTSILQSSDGRMLIGTYDGLNFFDGYDIRPVRHSAKRAGGLANNRIVSLHEASDSTIWIGLDRGVMRYDPRWESYTDYTAQVGAELTKVRAVCEDSSGDVWIGHEKGVVIATPDGRGGYAFLSAGGLETLNVNVITEDGRGNVWIGTSRGLYLCNREGRRNRSVRLIGDVPRGMVRSVEYDRWGMLWIGHNQGVYASADGERFTLLELPEGCCRKASCTIRDREDRLWVGCNTDGVYSIGLGAGLDAVSVEHYSKSDFFGRISDNDVSCMCIDRSGVLWVGTRRGVNHAPTAAPRFFTFKPLVGRRYTELGYDGSQINTLFIDDRGRLWINTYRGRTCRFDFRTQRMEDLSAALTPNSVARILQTADGTFWIAAQEGVYRVRELSDGRFDRQMLRLPDIPEDVPLRYRYFTDLCEDACGDIWIATTDGLIRYDPDSGRSTVYTAAHGLASGSIYSLLADREHNLIWAGSADNGLSKIRFDTSGPGIEVEVLRQDTAPYGLSDNHVWCLRMTRDGTIWVGTDAGLNRMTVADGAIRTVMHVDTPELEDAKILAVTEDAAGCLWLNGSQGLYCYEPATGCVKRYVSDDGLQSNTWTEGAAVSDNGWIFVGGINGVNYFNPAEFRTESYAGVPMLTDLKVLGRRVVPGAEWNGRVLLKRSLSRTGRLDLGYRQNNFTLEFTSDLYASPAKNLFRYRLEGYDPGWTVVGAGQRFASYTRLPAGRYVFRLASSNGDGVWSDCERRLEVVVRPAPWATWWAYLLYALAAAGVMAAGIAYLVSRQQWRRRLFMQQIEQEKTRELSEMKLNFYTNVTHELRTPLALITAPLKDLEEHHGADEYTRFRLGLIRRNVNKLLKLISQLLEIRRVSAQNLPLKVSRYDLALTVREVVHSFASISEQTGILLHFDAPKMQPDAWFDRDKIERVLQNLISNAFKFTPEQGDIHVRLEVELRDRVRYAVVSVRDSGVGIPSGDLHRIFDLFFHGTPLNGASSGVGLSFAKALIELHGGEITVSSEEGDGSLFTVRFPIDRDCYPDGQVEQTDAVSPSGVADAAGDPEPGGERPKYLVLIVEDNEDMCAYIADCLKGHFRTVVAGDGETGLAMAQKLKPDVVISDLMMPVMDGIRFTRRMKANPRTNFIPIIVHSVREDRQSIREALAAGAQEYVIKPFEAENLICRIRNLLNSREHFARKLKTETIVEPTAVELPSDDEQLLRRLSAVVETNMQNPLFDIEYLANELHMSRMQLYRRMQRIAGGRTVSEIIRDMRIKRAAQLLASGGMRVSEVMAEVGMNNQYRFTKYFQETFGMTPREYIQVHAEQSKH